MNHTQIISAPLGSSQNPSCVRGGHSGYLFPLGDWDGLNGMAFYFFDDLRAFSRFFWSKVVPTSTSWQSPKVDHAPEESNSTWFAS